MNIFKYYLDKAKYFLITLRLSILSVFITLFVFAILLIIIVNNIFSSKTLLFTANKLIHEVSVSLHREIRNEFVTAEKDSEFTVGLINDKLLNSNDFSKFTTYTLDLAKQFNIVQGAYWADEYGDFVGTSYDKNDTLTSEIMARNRLHPTNLIIYRDLQEKIIKTVQSNNLKYDPRTRPWYIAAKAAKKSIWTNIYLYEPNHYLGVTIATPVYENNGKLKGIFGMDIRLDWLSWYVGQKKISKNGIIFIVKKDGELIAFPELDKRSNQTKLLDIHALSPQWIPKSFDLYKKNEKNEFNFTYQGKDYLAVYRLSTIFSNHGWLFGIVAPKDDFTGELNKLNLINIGIGFFILLIGILLMSKLVTYIIYPIKQLVKESEKVKQFNLEDSERVHSRIKEIFSLSHAIHSMKHGLKSFRSYVPATLVRQLIETGENARIGGVKKSLVVLFSDIKDFTSITHKMEPNLLMEQLCEYFEELTQIIVKEQGTIDKYIGDSIMAFWGAPLPVDDPCQHAARAALKCISRLNELNAKWMKEGKHPLYTRIGIHMGEAIVGNLGSSERLNYTAIGDTINIASRLEGTNKTYGTKIIVSHAVYDKLKNQFVLREVDHVTLKGLTESENIYELIS